MTQLTADARPAVAAVEVTAQQPVTDCVGISAEAIG